MKVFWMICFTCLLSACISTAPRRVVEHDIPVPETWTSKAPTATQAEIEDTWWLSFQTPALSQAVEQALHHNGRLASAEADVRVAMERARAVGANLYPTVGISSDVNRNKQNFIGLPLGPDGSDVLSSTYTQMGVNINTRWEADIWGRLKAGTRAAIANAEAAEADLAALRLSLAGQTAKAWLAAVEFGEQVALTKKMLAHYERTLNQVTRRYERGLRTSLDVRLAKANLADTRAQLIQQEMVRDAGIRQLQLLMGSYPDASLKGAEGFPQLPQAIPAGLPADLISRRPDLAAAERRLESADQQLIAARRALYPSLTLSGSFGATSPDLDELLKGNFSVWGLATSLAQPLFQGGRLRAEIRASEATVDSHLHQFVHTALNAYGEVEIAMAAEQWMAQQHEALKEAHTQSSAALVRAEEQYDRGLVDYLFVLEAQRGVLGSESRILALRRQMLQNRVDLYMALGGGFTAQVSEGRRM